MYVFTVILILAELRRLRAVAYRYRALQFM